MTSRQYRVVMAAVTLVALTALVPAGKALAATNLAVFNFQLKTGQEDWVWLEKFMSDQMATDLVQDRSLSVIARDRMQLIAQKMKWTPEFATGNAKVMGGIRSQLKIEYLVTGVCSVKDDKLEITAQIVEVASRKEVFRKTVSGKTDQIIDLQKQLSAEVMSWFTKKPAGAILKTLPMWTRSIPAIRALYEGMHLYDQGRYAEGWLKFRESSREDNNYVEAVYWVGKMYYFMCRYEHARRTLEKFVYLDCLHPRTGDAIVEYVHTFEASGATTEELLALYKTVKERFPSTMITGRRPVTAQDWASARLAGILSREPDSHESDVVKRIAEAQWVGVGKSALIFSPDAPRQIYRFAEPQKIYGRATIDRDKEAIFRREEYDFTLTLQAARGYAFTSLRFEPLAKGSDAMVTIALRDPDSQHDIDPITVPLPDGRAEGIVLRPAPRRGMLTARCMLTSTGVKACAVTVEGITISATLERVVNHGGLEVQCLNTDDFRAEIDGAFGRWSSGLIGLLKPGRHRLTLRPATEHSPFGAWQSEVEIESGKIAHIRGKLPWRNQGPGAITTGRVVRQEVPLKPYALASQPAPAIYLDDHNIRMFWSRGGDLWSSFSKDGNSFSKPEMLALPVSTAWEESDPRIFRDESGRFILTFVSDRDGQHHKLAYFCWSRDLVNWSNPSVISDTSSRYYDIVQAPDGRFYCAIADTPHDWTMVTLLSTSDGYRWETMPGNQIAFNGSPVRLAVRSDGAIELYAVPTLPGTQNPSTQYKRYQYRIKSVYKQLVRYVHNGSGWSPKEILTGFKYDNSPDHISLTRDAHGLLVLATTGRWRFHSGSAQLLRETKGQWQSTGKSGGVALFSGELAYHPRWGYVMSYGGYFARSRHLPELIADAAMKTPKPVIVEPNPIARFRTTYYDADGRVKDVCIPFHPLRRARRPRRPKLPPSPPGELMSTIPGEYLFAESIRIEDQERFAKPAPGCGTVHPNAVVVTAEHNGLPISLALDSDDPNSVHYELVRIDFTGKGDFSNAVVVHRGGMQFFPPVKKYLTIFTAKSAYVKIDGRVIPVNIGVEYIETDRRKLGLQLRCSAEGTCRFGDKQYKVEIYDNNNNLHLGDAAWPGSKNGYDTVTVSCRPGAAPMVRYGEPVTIDGKLYDVRISADGNSVTAMDYKGPAGLLKIGRPAWNAWLITGNTRFSIAGGMDPIHVPPGEYKLAHYQELSSSDGSMPKYMLRVSGTAHVHVKSGKLVSLDMGSPVTGKLLADVSGRTVKFRYVERDASGNMVEIDLVERNHRSSGRHLRIVDSNNKSVIGLHMDSEFGQDGWNVAWHVRKGLSGTFKATVECDVGPFIPKPATVTFTVK